MKRIALCLFLAACEHGQGGGSAVLGSKTLVELDADQREQVCLEASSSVTEHQADCGEGGTVTVTFAVDICLDQIESFDPSCTATVDDILDCAEDFGQLSDPEVCSGQQPSSCDPLASCNPIVEG